MVAHGGKNPNRSRHVVYAHVPKTIRIKKEPPRHPERLLFYRVEKK